MVHNAIVDLLSDVSTHCFPVFVAVSYFILNVEAVSCDHRVSHISLKSFHTVESSSAANSFCFLWASHKSEGSSAGSDCLMSELSVNV